MLAPLAERMRPRTLDNFLGQSHLDALKEAIAQDKVASMILWGPPGSGKTSLASLVAQYTRRPFTALSAAKIGVKELRSVMAARDGGVLFLDEVHRFNKAQQDALLPYVEDGSVLFIGATTENPSFELNSALLSRARVFILKPLDQEALRTLIDHALQDKERGLGGMVVAMLDHVRDILARAADGDARRAMNLLEAAVTLGKEQGGSVVVDEESLEQALGEQWRRFDKGGEAFYDQISAMHKSIRGSDPDAALYWMWRMLDGGADPLYVARRVVRAASEDVGNADPRALQIALSAKEAYDFLGSPEGELALAQAVLYVACAPKSNAAYMAVKKVQKTVRTTGSLEVPLHLRNAPTKLMKELGYGREYLYDHDFPGAVAPHQTCLPEALLGQRFYQPADRGVEVRISEWMREAAKRRKGR